MPTTVDDIEGLIQAEITRISQPELRSRINSLLVPVRCELREWDYGEPGQTHPCWIVAEHSESNTAFAYCEFGFGPRYPWGLLSAHGQHMSMGMDSGWFTSLEEAFRGSFAWEGENPPGYEVG
jgi:hypothetical protein